MENKIIKTEYAERGLSNIFSVGFLAEEDKRKLTSIQDGILDSWQKTKIWRSETDMRYSVLQESKFPTKGHKYLQCQVEQEVHFRELMYLSTDYEEAQGQLEILKAELDELLEEKNIESTNPIEDRKLEGKITIKKAQIKRMEWRLLEQEKAGHHRVREVTLWEKLKKELNDGSFNPDDYEAILKDGYEKRFKAQLQAELESGNPSGNRLSVLSGSIKAMQHANNN